MTIVLIVIGVLVVLFLLWLMLGYNGLVSRRNRVDGAWSQIDVQLKRRYDLIPNLVETVKGYAAHERGTFEAVTNARANAINAEGPEQQAQAENQLTGALKSLFAVAEAYPDLKANQNFLQLAGGDHVHGGPHRVLAAVLQRQCRELQHEDPAVPDVDPRQGLQLRTARAVRRRTGGHRAGSGAVLAARRRFLSSPHVRADRGNKRRTFIILFGFVGLISAVAVAFDLLFGGGVTGLVIIVIIAAAMALFSYFNSDKVALAASHAKPADETEYRRYHNLVEGLVIAAGLPKPRLYVVDDPAPNAFATGRNPKHAAIAVTTGLLDTMNRVELEGVLAHELAHVKNYDILVTTVAVIAVGAIRAPRRHRAAFRVLGRSQRLPARQQQLRWARTDHRAARARAPRARAVRRLRDAVRDESQP